MPRSPAHALLEAGLRMTRARVGSPTSSQPRASPSWWARPSPPSPDAKATACPSEARTPGLYPLKGPDDARRRETWSSVARSLGPGYSQSLCFGIIHVIYFSFCVSRVPSRRPSLLAFVQLTLPGTRFLCVARSRRFFWAEFSWKGPNSEYFGFSGHEVSVATAQLCPRSTDQRTSLCVNKTLLNTTSVGRIRPRTVLGCPALEADVVWGPERCANSLKRTGLADYCSWAGPYQFTPRNVFQRAE